MTTNTANEKISSSTTSVGLGTISIKAREEKGITTIKMLIRHPMETGQRKNEDGELVPINYITKVSVVNNLNKQTIFNANWGASIAKDPIMAFKVKGLKKGDEITIIWQNHLNVEQLQKAVVE
ncbi:MAG: thiosulfate oxidation carrier complex protein SoxZ [Pseudomonadota bacterium]|jgi:sulfur-oxidizing protein SoxZ